MIVLGELRVTKGVDDDGDEAWDIAVTGNLSSAEIVGMLEALLTRERRRLLRWVEDET